MDFKDGDHILCVDDESSVLVKGEVYIAVNVNSNFTGVKGIYPRGMLKERFQIYYPKESLFDKLYKVLKYEK